MLHAPILSGEGGEPSGRHGSRLACSRPDRCREQRADSAVWEAQVLPFHVGRTREAGYPSADLDTEGSVQFSGAVSSM